MFEVTSELVGRIEEILGRGLCHGQGDPSKQMCVEAAVCYAMGLPHGDNPPCVGEAVRFFKMSLNDSTWSSDLARANGMRKIAIAQLGSNTLDQVEFARIISEKTIRILIPTLFREVFKDKEACLRAADLCEMGGGSTYAADHAARAASATKIAGAARVAADAAYAAADAAYAANAADRAAHVAAAAAYTDTATCAAVNAAYDATSAAAYAAAAASYATTAAARLAADTYEAAAIANDYISYAAAGQASDKYLTLSAELCYQVLDEMNSPGAVWMRENNWQ